MQFVDPATATDTQLADAFRHYTPQGQRPRMITLFTGLFRAAGIGPEKAKSSTAAAPRLAPTKTGGTRLSNSLGRHLAAAQRRRRNEAAHSGGISPPTDIHPAIGGLLASLPEKWTKDDKERFITAFTAVLDLAIPVVEPAASQGEEGDDAAVP